MLSFINLSTSLIYHARIICSLISSDVGTYNNLGGLSFFDSSDDVISSNLYNNHIE